VIFCSLYPLSHVLPKSIFGEEYRAFGSCRGRGERPLITLNGPDEDPQRRPQELRILRQDVADRTGEREHPLADGNPRPAAVLRLDPLYA